MNALLFVLAESRAERVEERNGIRLLLAQRGILVWKDESAAAADD